jgi:hypothetical protein
MRDYSSVNNELYDLGLADGRALGFEESVCEMLSLYLRQFGQGKFGALPFILRTRLQALELALARPQLERLASELPESHGWEALLADVTIPSERPPLPAYVVPWDNDNDPIAPALDESMVLNGPKGHMIVHTRFQRHYQENVDELIANERFQAQAKAKANYPVTTVVILMRKEADGPKFQNPPEGLIAGMRRLWEEPVEVMLSNAIMAPYTPFAKFEPPELASVFRRMEEAFVKHAKQNPEMLDTFRLLAYLSAGMRYPVAEVKTALGELLPLYADLPLVVKTRSQGFHMGRAEAQEAGALQGMRLWIRKFGGARFGTLPEKYVPRVEGANTRERLGSWCVGLLLNANWKGVFDDRPGKRKRK